MSILLMSQAWVLTELSAQETLVLLALADHADDDGICWPSLDHLAMKARCTPDSVSRVIKRLTDLKFVSKRRRSRKTSVYKLTLIRSTIESHESTLATDDSTPESNHSPILPNHQEEPSIALAGASSGIETSAFKGTEKDPNDPFHLTAEERRKRRLKKKRQVLKRTKVALEDKADPPYEEIAELYSTHCVPAGFLEIYDLTPQRCAAIKERWYESPKRQRLVWWEAYFKYVATRAKGLHGKDWANFGFLIGPKMVDISEGKYEQAFTR